MTRRKNRVLPLLLALAMLLALVAGTGFTAFAEEAPQDAPACTHTHDEECGFAEGSEGQPCTFVHTHDEACGFDGETAESCGFDPASHTHNEECGYAEGSEGQPCTHSCELCTEKGAGDDGENEAAEDPPALTSTITGFAVMDTVKVALNTPADEVPLPTEVTATVQPEGENAERATVAVGVGAWSLYFGEYTPEKASMCLYQADAASLSLPEGVSLPEEAELPLVRVEVGEFKMDIAPMAAAITDGGILTFDGASLTAAGANNLAALKAPTLAQLDGDAYTWFVGNGTDGEASTLYLNNFEYATTASTGLRIGTNPATSVNATIQLAGKNTITCGSGTSETNGIQMMASAALTITEQAAGSGASLAVETRNITSGSGMDNYGISANNSAGALSIAAKLTISVGTTVYGDTVGVQVPNALNILSGPISITVANAGGDNYSAGIVLSSNSAAMTMYDGDLTISVGTGAFGSYGLRANSATVTLSGGSITAQAHNSTPRSGAISANAAIAGASFTGGATSSDSYALSFLSGTTNAYVYTTDAVTDEPALYATNKLPVVPPTVVGNDIYANGTALVVQSNGGSASTVYIDDNRNGVVDTDEKSLADAGIANAPANALNLANYSLYGGSSTAECLSGTKITLLGGLIRAIHGGGADTLSPVGGKAEITIAGGQVDSVTGAGQAKVAGGTTITMTNGVVRQNIYGGNHGNAATGNGKVAITITGGTVGQNVYAGSSRGATVAGSTVTVGGTAVVGSSGNYGVVINFPSGDNVVTNGINEFKVAPKLETGALVRVALGGVVPTSPANYKIGTHTNATDINHIELVGIGAEGRMVGIFGSDIVVNEETRQLYFGKGTGFASNDGWGLYTDNAFGTEYNGNTGKWSAAAGKLTLKGFVFTTAANNPLTITPSAPLTEIALASGSVNTLKSVYAGTGSSAALVGSGSNISFTGTGSLTATGSASSRSQGIQSNRSLLIDGPSITAECNPTNNSSDCVGVTAGGTLMVRSGLLTAVGGSSGLRAEVGLSVTGGKIIASSPTLRAAYITGRFDPDSITAVGKENISDTSLTEASYNASFGTYMLVTGGTAKYLELTSSATKPNITSIVLPDGAQDVAYSTVLAATGTAPITWALTDGTLPEGLTLNSDGTISGTPTVAGNKLFTVTATNSAGSDSKLVGIIIEAAVPPSITTTSLPGGTVGIPYSTALAATGRTPITWELTDGALPEGLSLNSDGTISGTPTAAGTGTFSVKASSNWGETIKQLSITITGEGDPAPGTPDPNDPEINGNLPLLLMPGADEASIILGIAASNANSYQWYKDGVVISGATGENLTVDKNGGDGQYYVVVSGNGKTLQTNTCTVQWSTNKGSAAVMVMPEPGAPTPVLQNPQAVLDAALTEAEKAELKGDTTAQFIVILQVKPAATESPEATQKAQDEGYTVGGHYDLSLMKMKEGGTSQAGYPMAVTQLNGKIRIQIAIPAEMQAEDRVFAFVRVHNGVATVLEDIDTDPATITIETDQFSPYTLVYKTGATAPPVVKPPVVKPPKATPSPQTGDAGNAGLWALLAVLACGTLGGSLLVLRQGGKKAHKIDE